MVIELEEIGDGRIFCPGPEPIQGPGKLFGYETLLASFSCMGLAGWPRRRQVSIMTIFVSRRGAGLLPLTQRVPILAVSSLSLILEG